MNNEKTLYLVGETKNKWQKEILSLGVYLQQPSKSEIEANEINTDINSVLFLKDMIDIVDSSQNKGKLPDAVNAWNLFNLDKADILFVYLDSESAGLDIAATIGFAKAQKKTIIFVNRQDDNPNTYNLEEMSDVVFYSLEEAIVYLLNLIFPGIQFYSFQENVSETGEIQSQPTN